MKKGRILRKIALGIATAIPGPHFLAGAFAAEAARRRPLVAGVPAVIAACLTAWAFGGLEGGLICAAVISGVLLSNAKSLPDADSAFLTAGIASLAGAASLLEQPGIMGMDPAALESLVPLYASAGIPPSQVRSVIDTMLYLSPGIGAFQIAVGSMLAVRFTRTLAGSGAQGRHDVRLGLFPAWLVIGALVSTVAGAGTDRPLIAEAGANVLVFLAAPYGLVGGLVIAESVRNRPLLLASGIFLFVAATPLVLGGVVLTGLLDTWFDFRSRMRLSGSAGPQ